MRRSFVVTSIFFVALIQAEEDGWHSDGIRSACEQPSEGTMPEPMCLLQLQTTREKTTGQGKQQALKVFGPLDGDVKESDFPYPDWFFTATTGSCQTAGWSVTRFTAASRACLPALFLVLLAFIVINGKAVDDSGAGSEDPQGDGEEQTGRRHDLDFARIVCVACVVTEHSGGKHWSEHNVAFVLQWVLPYLYLTSAISWTVSTRGVGSYVMRLFIILFVGAGANWVADALTGRNWRGDFGNTVFQMFYVVMLIAMSVWTAPLREALRQRKSNPLVKAGAATLGWQFWAALVINGIITLAAFVGFFTQKEGKQLVPVNDPYWSSHLTPLINDAPIALIQIGGAMFLCHFACLYRANDLLPWLLLLHIFLPRIFLPWEQVGFIHNLELFVFGMAAESWSIRGRRTITTLLRNYWPVILFIFIVISMPDISGRCDLMPPLAHFERVRFYGIELALCLFLCCRAFQVGDPWNATGWLNYWALYAYCFHVAWARIFPIPYGAMLTYGSIGVFYMASQGKSKPGTSESSSGNRPPATTEGPDIAGGH